MYKINCLNKISKEGLNLLTDNYKVSTIEDCDAILVRSQAMHDMALNDNVVAIARAGAGVNNIPLNDYANKGIVVFNTPGANANGVKELVLGAMLLACRDIYGGISYVLDNKEDANLAKNVEKAKAKYAGVELLNKKVGVIGLGAIGVMVANCCVALGMDVYGCDPYLSLSHAINLDSNVKIVKTNEELYEICDFITIHVPLTQSTKNLINKESIALMKKDAVLLNFSRDLLVDEVAVIESLENEMLGKYITDFPNLTTAGKKNVIALPHLGASTEESEDNCAKMAVKQIMDYLENGNITNSVNYPNVYLGELKSGYRITIAHENIVNMISQFTNILAKNDINIINMVNKSLNNVAYTIIDVSNITPLVEEELNKIDKVFKTRILSR